MLVFRKILSRHQMNDALVQAHSVKQMELGGPAEGSATSIAFFLLF